MTTFIQFSVRTLRALLSVTALTALGVAALPALGCSSGGTTTTTTGASTGETSTTLSLTETCSGKYTCTVDGTSQSVPTVLQLEDGVCHAGRIELTKDGVARSPGTNATAAGTTSTEPIQGFWNGTASAFDICEGQTCVHCKAEGTPGGGPGSGSSSGATCHGSPGSCNGGAGSCGTTRGCNLHIHYTYSNGQVSGTQYECVGSPESCASFGDEQGCKRQGCDWS